MDIQTRQGAAAATTFTGIVDGLAGRDNLGSWGQYVRAPGGCYVHVAVDADRFDDRYFSFGRLTETQARVVASMLDTLDGLDALDDELQGGKGGGSGEDDLNAKGVAR